MANVFMLVGDTGTGKSNSLEGLNSKETFLINCAGKPLPFRGSSRQYSTAEKNLVNTSRASDIVGLLKGAGAQQHIKQIIVDDAGFVMTEFFFAKAQESGYQKFSELAQNFQRILSTAKDLRSDLNVVFIMHEEDEISNGIKVRRKIKTVGKLLDDQYQPLSVATVALFTDVTFNKEGVAVYEFITNRTVVQGQVIPAKSPRGMFDQLRIPNDLSVVFAKANEYYAGETV